jgi:hypothetical protein
VQQRQGGEGYLYVNTFVGAYKVHKKVKIDLIGDRRVLKKEAVKCLIYKENRVG